MDSILNKSYKRKNAPESDTFVVDKIDGDFVVFSNGARCKMDTLQNDFAEVGTHNSVNENSAPNPDTFFNTPSVDETLLSQLETVVKNPNVSINSSRLHESVSLDEPEDDNKQYEKVGPGKNNQSNGFANRMADEPAQVNTQNTVSKSTRLPEWDVFDNVKLTDEIEITVPFKIKLPRAEKIDVLNDMFKTSFTSYLAKKYIADNIVNNSAKLQLILQKSIEDWVETEIGVGKKRKPAKKSKAVKVEPPEVKESVIAVDTPADNASSFFGNGPSGPAWDGNVKTLFVINTAEQYNAVKKMFIQLKDSGINSPDVDRYEDMLQTYEEQTK
jgi:hypothetical protein